VIEAKPYRYQGNQGWDPAKLGPMQTQSQRKDARVAEFARLREQGMGIAVASAGAGVNRETGRQYERARLRGAS
jgi:hypothetical protein